MSDKANCYICLTSHWYTMATIIDSVITTSTIAPGDAKPANRDRLTGTDSLKVGQRLVSPSGNFNLIFQDDGNLVLYDGKKSIWAANSSHRVNDDSKALLDLCKLRVNAGSGRGWSIERDLSNNSTYLRLIRKGPIDNAKVLLLMRDDGNVVLSYDNQVLWTTKTSRRVDKRIPGNGNPSYLYVGEPLWNGNTLLSQNNGFELKMEGDIVLRWNGKEVWRQPSGGGARPTKLELRANGELALLGALDMVSWSSGTAGKGDEDSYLAVGDDGDVTINSNGTQIWRSNSKQDVSKKPQPSPSTPKPDPGPPGPDRLRAGEKLSNGQSIVSPNGRYKMILQGDGNFVLYDGSKSLWATGTTAADQVNLLDNDNLTVGINGVVFWSSNSTGRTGGGAAVLIIRDDGNPIIMSDGKIVWSTDSSLIQPSLPNCDPLHPDNMVLRSGQYLPVNQPLNSKNGQFSAILLSNGTLVVRRNITKTTVWALNNTSNKTAVQLALGFNAELAIYASDESKIWSSKRQEDGKAFLTMQDDGKLVLSRNWLNQEIWSSGISFPVTNGPKDSLTAGQSLAVDQVLTAGDYSFGFTSVCNLFIRNRQGNTTYFYTAPKEVDNAARFTCNDNCVLEIFDTNNNSLWKSQNKSVIYQDGSFGGDDKRFILRDDGRAYVEVHYQILWSASEQTSGPTPKAPQAPPPKIDAASLPAGGSLLPGTSLYSLNRIFQLTYQQDGNLVLYKNGQVKWSSDTWRNGAGKVTLQNDGNLVMTDPSGRTSWSSNKTGSGSVVLRMQDDGNVVIYAGDRAIWASNNDKGRKH